ncbi:YhcN/YlaJ family sporulation lipoprotein [Paenibacillus psychroresistens]|uniref:YhcN/YlaJ family sporulation lipoprotein n=1 Tax=Paenibacillus psychroresistens TaxID=1778678 RepID=A0A6B8RTC2_9BACL|nr:YhcN/YlaJ family sporulation lipoprotein [Paenibacillus psychroresistens]QGQ99012.1 YhcN/YlaJ family sporulation lipoprotein [Paenibacillus psychroresistens]
MFTKATKVMVTLVFVFSLVTAGCTSNAKHQVKQQGTTMQQAPNNVNMKMDNRFDIAQAAADRIIRITGVKGANVLVTKHNAYVAAVVNTPANQISRALEDQIAAEVRATDPTIKNVYVSTNPEFVDRVKQYVYEARTGRPVSGFFNELNQMIQRIFPVSR